MGFKKQEKVFLSSQHKLELVLGGIWGRLPLLLLICGWVKTLCSEMPVGGHSSLPTPWWGCLPTQLRPRGRGTEVQHCEGLLPPSSPGQWLCRPGCTLSSWAHPFSPSCPPAPASPWWPSGHQSLQLSALGSYRRMGPPFFCHSTPILLCSGPAAQGQAPEDKTPASPSQATPNPHGRLLLPQPPTTSSQRGLADGEAQVGLTCTEDEGNPEPFLISVPP